jgi:hypothetical protein
MKRGTWQTRYCEVTAGQTFEVGDWVYKVAAGTLSIAAASGAAVDTSTAGVLPWGRALANAADVLADSGQFPDGCPVECPGYDGEFLVAVVGGTSGETAALDATDLDGASSAITLPMVNISGQWCVNEAGNGTDDCLLVVERHPEYAFGEAYGWFWAKIMPGERLESAS